MPHGADQPVEGALENEPRRPEPGIGNRLERRGGAHGGAVEDDGAPARDPSCVVEGPRHVGRLVETDARLVPPGASRSIEVHEESVQAQVVEDLGFPQLGILAGGVAVEENHRTAAGDSWEEPCLELHVVGSPKVSGFVVQAHVAWSVPVFRPRHLHADEEHPHLLADGKRLRRQGPVPLGTKMSEGTRVQEGNHIEAETSKHQKPSDPPDRQDPHEPSLRRPPSKPVARLGFGEGRRVLGGQASRKAPRFPRRTPPIAVVLPPGPLFGVRRRCRCRHLVGSPQARYRT